ncbi:MAG: HAD-IA family hydrolase [Anaerolineaceae bacterium]
MIEGLVFDFDGLMLDTETPEYDAWKEIFSQYGATLPYEEWSKCLGSDYNSFDPLEYLIQQTGVKLDKMKILEQQRSRSAELASDQQPLPGVCDLIMEAKKARLLLAVASSSDAAWVVGHLERVQLKDSFNVICTSENVERVKPAPDLFKLAVDWLGIAPDHAVAFEDTMLGIQSAKKAGLYCVAIPNEITSRMDFSQADWVVNSMAELNVNILQQRFA